MKHKQSTSQNKKTQTRRTTQEIAADAGVVGNFVRAKRKLLNYTQEELADRSGLSLPFIKAIEKGKKTARMDKVNALLAYFGAELVPQPIRRDLT